MNSKAIRQGSAVRRASRHRGSAMIEFAVVGPLLVLLGTTILQYALMFNAKNMVNHASFMAAREGSLANADLGSVRQAYARALVPLYGGGRSGRELGEALLRAQADIAVHSRIELLNPIRESFDDWADESLSQGYGGRRAIRNANLAFRDASQVGASSGQNIQDANLIKLKITHGYELKVPLASTVMQFMMRWNDSRSDPFVTALYAQRRIPLVSHVTLQMQSDPVEPGNPVSMPGQGNNGNPSDPGLPLAPPITPPNCVTAGCTVIVDPTLPPGGGAPGGGGATGNPPLFGCPPGDPNCTPLCPAV
jgi:Flp pilus assembly protein TadG